MHRLTRNGRPPWILLSSFLRPNHLTTYPTIMSNSASPDQGSYHGADHAQGPPRKKMRKGTKSCIECRRRKIKCTFEPGRTSICNECFARGSTCIDQEHGDISSFTNQSSNSTSKDEQNSALKERVTYLEDLVKQVLDRLPEKNGSDTSPVAQSTENSSLQADAQAGKLAYDAPFDCRVRAK